MKFCPKCDTEMEERTFNAEVHAETTAVVLEPVGNVIPVILYTCPNCKHRESHREDHWKQEQ